MKRSKSSKMGRSSFGAGLESLEDRQFMSGDTAGVVNQAKAQLSATVSAIITRIENAFAGASSAASSSTGSTSAKAGTKKADPPPKMTDEALARLRADAALLSSSKAALAQAIKQLVGTDPAAGYEAGKRILIADNLSLPADALKSKLSATELLEHVTELQAAGGQDQQSSVAYWQTVNTKGADAALAGVVASNLGIPAAAVVGKKAKEIVDDAGNINLMGADVRSVKAWQGLGLLKAGKISVEQYAKDYTDASDVGKGSGASGAANNAQPATQAAKDVKDAVGATGVAERVTGGSVGNNVSNVSNGTATTGATAGNASVGANTVAAGGATSVQTSPPAGTGEAAVTNQPAVTNSPPATSNTASSASENAPNSDPGGRVVGTISNVHNENGTSTYTLTKTYSNGASTTVQVTVHPDGSADVVSENGSVDHYPAGSTDPMPDSGEGQTIVLSEDDDGDGYGDSGTYYPPSDGAGDGSDGNGDDDDDNNNGNNNGDNANTDTAPPPADSQGDGGNGGAPAASGEPTPDTDTSNPQKKNDFYQNNPIGRAVAGSMSPSGPTGGAGDPEDPGNTNPAARKAFENSPLGSKGKGVRVLGGAIDYPDGERSTSIVVDARQLQAIAIRAGGAVGGPEAGKPVTVNGGGNTGGGVIPTTPVKGGGSGTTSATTSAAASTSATVSSVVPFSNVRVSASVSGITSAAITAKVSTAVFAK